MVGKSMEAKQVTDLVSIHSKPREIISDNTKAFKVAAKFIDNLGKSETLHEYIVDQDTKWDFALAKTVWGGAFCERLNRDKEHTVPETWKKTFANDGLKRVIEDMEVLVNNRPFQNVRDEIGSRV